MTRTPTQARPTATTAAAQRDRAATDKVLRDMAFVLQLTQRVKSEIVADQAAREGVALV